ncbi:hypothetical protein ACS0TY_035028 [Phlomoides rotata]
MRELAEVNLASDLLSNESVSALVKHGIGTLAAELSEDDCHSGNDKNDPDDDAANGKNLSKDDKAGGDEGKSVDAEEPSDPKGDLGGPSSLHLGDDAAKAADPAANEAEKLAEAPANEGLGGVAAESTDPKASTTDLFGGLGLGRVCIWSLKSFLICTEEISLNSKGTTDRIGCASLPGTACLNGTLEENPSEVRKEFVAPAVGMEFECYDNAYNYYNCYAREAGFSVRVKNSWFKRNCREKYGVVLCCSSQGFKRVKDVNHLQKETRTGCPAMMRMRLVDSKRWRILEVTLEHNHLLGAEVHKGIKSGIKRKFLSNSYTEVQPVKLYRTLVIDAGSDGASNFNQKHVRTPPDEAK